MKTILIPTDFSETANKARDYAAKLALFYDAELVVSHAYEVPLSVSGAGSMRNIDKLHRDDARKKLNVQEKQLKEKFPALRFRTYNDASLPVASVKGICKTDNIDLVVMGTTGASGIKDKLIGSNTASMIGEITVPLITIPSHSNLEYPQRIALATDFESQDIIKDIGPVLTLNKAFKAKVDIVVVNNEKVSKAEIETTIEAIKKTLGDSFGVLYILGNEDVEVAILEHLKSSDSDMLSVISHNKSFWQRLWEKSISRAIVKHAEIPVLVLTETE